MLLVDIDGFKGVNDRDGHAAGDAVLCSVTEALRGAVRDGDPVFRLGGDESPCMLEQSGLAVAVGVADRGGAGAAAARGSAPRPASRCVRTTDATRRRCSRAPTRGCTPASASDEFSGTRSAPSG